MASGTPWIERALGISGGLLVAVIAAYLLLALWQGQGSGTPAITVELGPARALDGAGWVVPFRAVNRGSAPAAAVELEAALALPDGSRERSELVIDYLASGASQEGGFLFAVDPGVGTLTARPLGYLRP